METEINTSQEKDQYGVTTRLLVSFVTIVVFAIIQTKRQIPHLKKSCIGIANGAQAGKHIQGFMK